MPVVHAPGQFALSLVVIARLRARTVSRILVAGFVMAGCAAVMPHGELQGSEYRHWNPDHSFRVPEGWRGATPSDATLLSINRLALARLDEQGRRRVIQLTVAGMSQDVGLVSARGAWMAVKTGGRSDIRLLPGYRLTDQERQALWEATRDSAVGQLSTRYAGVVRPDVTLESMEVADYGANVAIQVRFRSSDSVSGTWIFRYLAFFTGSHVIGVTHITVPPDPDEGVAGLTELARSLRFR